jgi:hypothetical protein
MAMLSEGQTRELQTLVLKFLGTTLNYEALANLLGHQHAGMLRPPENLAAAARWVVEQTLCQPTPDLFISVVSKVTMAAGQSSPDIIKIATTLEGDKGKWIPANTLADLWVPHDAPFLNRTDLRSAVARAVSGQGSHVITIEAPPGHGKRTMSAYISLVTLRAGTVRPLARTLEPGPDAGLLDALVADLRRALQLPSAGPTTHEEPEREAEVLAHLLSQEARKSLARVWFVVHLIRPAELEPGVVRFVDELLGAVQADAFTAAHLRIAVLSEKLMASGLTRLPPPSDRFILPEVDAQAVMQWLVEAVPGKPKDLYSAATEEVLRKLDERRPAPSRRLEWLGRHCADAYELLKKV